MIRRAAATLLALAAAAAPARAGVDDVDDGDPDGHAPPTRDHVNLRLGGATTDTNGRPVICAEVYALARLSFEGCGTGSGILHHAPGQEMAHFRAAWQVAHWDVQQRTVLVRASAGIAELQLGDDRLGLDFGAPASDQSVAGPEGGLSAQLVLPVGEGVEAIANLQVGLAWFEGAPQLEVPQSRWQPFASVEVGVGW